MKGLEIFVHSVRLVFTNLEAALRISLVPYLISGIAMVTLGLPAIMAMIGGEFGATAQIDADVLEGTNVDPGVWINFLIYMLIYAVTALWIAVTWHRYVLVEEYPNGWIAPLHGGLMVSYFLKGMAIILVIVLATLVVTLVFGLALGWLGGLGTLLISVGTIAASTYLFYRLCPVLPSAAVGKPMTMAEAWEATNETGGAIFMLVVLVLIASMVIQLPATLGAADSVFAMVYSYVIGWVTMLVGVSVLTTFYGHFVEGRPID